MESALLKTPKEGALLPPSDPAHIRGIVALEAC